MTNGKGGFFHLFLSLQDIITFSTDICTEGIAIKLWVDVTKKIYPGILVQLTNFDVKKYGINIDNFIIMYNNLGNEGFEGFISASKNRSVFDINSFVNIPSTLNFLTFIFSTYGIMKNITFEKVYSIYLVSILTYYRCEGMSVDITVKDSILEFIKSHFPEALKEI